MTRELPSFDEDAWGILLKNVNLDPTLNPDSKWGVEEVKYDTGNNTERIFKITKDFLDINLEIRTDSLLINWDASIPSYLSPGQGADKMFEMIEIIAHDIPHRFRPDPEVSEEQSRNQHRNLSRIKLETTQGDTPWMKLIDERGIAELAVVFASPSNIEYINSLHVIGTKSLFKKLNYSYLLAVVYPKDSESKGEIRIQIPITPKIHSSLNPDAMEWILQSHYHLPSLKEIEKEAAILSDLSVSCLDKWAIEKGAI